jgi:hypothetical protein
VEFVKGYLQPMTSCATDRFSPQERHVYSKDEGNISKAPPHDNVDLIGKPSWGGVWGGVGKEP